MGGRNVPAQRIEDKDMTRTLVAAAAAVLAFGGIVNAAPAVVAEPRRGFQGAWECEGPPHYNGPLQNAWSHGLTTSDLAHDSGLVVVAEG